METLIEALKQLESEMVIWLVPLAVAAVLTYITVYLFYHYGPLAGMRADSRSDRRGLYEDEEASQMYSSLR